jgi:hypothetical protein
MSLYNALFGKNPFAPSLLMMLGIDETQVPRFRDCYLNADREIVIYTRTGGSNRAAYQVENEALTRLPGYLRNRNDEFDSTFTYFIYQPSAEFSDLVAEIVGKQGVIDPRASFDKLIADLQAKKDTPETRRAMQVGRDVFRKIERGDRMVVVADPDLFER